MLLAIDIGNTMVTMGVFRSEQDTAGQPAGGQDSGEELATTLRIATDSRRSADEYGLLLTNLLQLNSIDRAEVSDVCICSVVPPLTGVFESVARSYFKVEPLTVTGAVETGLEIGYDNPRTWAPTVSPTLWPRRCCTASPPSSWTSAPPRCST